MVEYESEFASLSRFAVELVSTNEHRCQRFRHGLNGGITSRIISFRERDYVDLVDMASRIGKDIIDVSERRVSNNNSKGVNYSGLSN